MGSIPGGRGRRDKSFSHSCCSQGSMTASGLGRKEEERGGRRRGRRRKRGGRGRRNEEVRQSSPFIGSLCPPQVMLVIPQCQGHKGRCPQLQQPSIEFFGHKIVPVMVTEKRQDLYHISNQEQLVETAIPYSHTLSLTSDRRSLPGQAGQT